MDTYHWDVLVTYHWDGVGCFIWDLSETLWRYTDGTWLLRPLETSSRCSNKMSWRRTAEMSWQRSTNTSLGVSFETYLRRCWDVQRDVVTMSLRRHVAGWGKSIVVSDKFEHSVKGFKYFIGYKNDNIIKPLCIILPEMSSFIKYFDNGGKKLCLLWLKI